MKPPSLENQAHELPELKDLLQERVETPSAIFDPRHEVPQHVWQRLLEYWDQETERKWTHNNSIALAVGLFRPDLVPGLELTEVDSNTLRDAMPLSQTQLFDKPSKTAITAGLKFSQKVLYPNLFLINEQFIEEALNYYQDTSNGSIFFNSQVGTGVELKILIPSRVKELSRLERDRAQLEAVLDDSRNEQDWYGFIWAAKSWKILFPKEIERLGLDASTWQTFHDYLDDVGQFSKNSSLNEASYAENVLNLAILAGDLQITDTEIHVLFPTKPIVKSITALPEVTKFERMCEIKR